MAALTRVPSNLPRPSTPKPSSSQESPQVTISQPVVIFNLSNPIYANGQMTTPEGYVTYPDLPHVFGGGLKNGLPTGYGIQKNSTTGNTYEGGWKDGRAHGYGVFYWANGDRYEGGWKEGLQHGFAELTGSLGGAPTRIEAQFRDGVRISPP